MAGKSGRTIDASPKNRLKQAIFSWEAILVVLFIGVIVLCKSISPYYTFANVLREMPKYLAEVFLFFPMAYILMLGEIDISVGSIVCLCGTSMCLIANAGVPFGLALVLTLLVGVLCGAINGFVITKFPELPSMIVTLGTQIIFRGIAEIILGSGGSVSAVDKEGLKWISMTKIGPFSICLICTIVCAIVFTIVSVKGQYGREIMAIGSNRATAKYSGIKVNKKIFVAYILVGLFAAIGAIFLLSSSFGANTTTGKGFEMDAIAMAAFGGIATTGGKGRMIGGIISAFIIVCLRIGLQQVNLNSQLILLIIGVLLIAAVLLPNLTSKISRKKS